MTIQILSSGRRDLVEGRDFYERQCAGVGDYFLNSLFSDIDSLARYAGTHRKIFGFHRLLSKRFPWAIYHRVAASKDVVVYRVLDCRQNPRRTKSALQTNE